eukprot:ANDGO_03221.mRNA.1 Gamma-tubulin complex component 4
MQILLEQLCKVGFLCRSLDEFVRSLKSASLFLPALSHGVHQILSGYRSLLAECEERLAIDAVLPLAQLEHMVADYRSVFPAVMDVVDQVRVSGVSAGKLMSMLYDLCKSGNPVLRRSMQTLQSHVHRVFFRQLASWMVYGMLYSDDFFIRDRLVSSMSVHASPSRNPLRPQSVVSPENAAPSASTMEDMHIFWTQRYSLNFEALPVFLSVQVAEMILFAGKTMQILSHQSKNDQRTVLDDDDDGDDNVQPLRMRDADRRASYSTAESSGSPAHAALLHPSAGDVVRGEEQYILALLTEMQNQSILSPAALEQSISLIRRRIAQCLWNVVVVDARLPEHMDVIRNYFLLGRGDFFQCFVEECRGLFDGIGIGNVNGELESAFSRAATRSATLDGDPMFSNLTISLTNPNWSPAEAVAQIQAQVMQPPISLYFKLQWPLQLFFSPEKMATYNRLFRFLFALKRVQIQLQDAWATLMEQTDLRAKRNHENEVHLFKLRHSMSFLIDNLQFYIHVDVLEVQIANLMEIFRAQSRDFEALQRAHASFLTDICEQCFFSTPVVERVLEDLCTKVLQFCSLVRRHFGAADAEPFDPKELQTVSEGFDRQAHLLFKILSGVRGPVSPHLAQLLLRFDFNQYFSGV